MSYLQQYMYSILKVLVLSVILVHVNAQCPPGRITLNTQSQVDSFRINYDCDTIGSLTITGADIQNLDSLSKIVAINGYLRIQQNGILRSLEGLGNLQSIEDDLYIYSNYSISHLKGLDNLQSIGGYLYIGYNCELDSITALESLLSVGSFLRVEYNEALSGLKGLERLQSINEYVHIVGNSAIASLEGLDSIGSIGGDLSIISCDSLTNLMGLKNLQTIGEDFWVTSNQNITSLAGLDRLEVIDGNLYIRSNASLTDCALEPICQYLGNASGEIDIERNASGCNSVGEISTQCSLPKCINVHLFTQEAVDTFNCDTIYGNLLIGGTFDFPSEIENLDSLITLSHIGGELKIEYCEDLDDLSGLDSLKTIGQDFRISRNNLSNLVGLESLQTIGGDLSIYGNYLITQLKGLDNLRSIGGNSRIELNYHLRSLEGLESLQSIGSYFLIYKNDELVNLRGLENLQIIGEELSISNNDKLRNLQGLGQLQMIGKHLFISDNQRLETLIGLNSLDSVGFLVDEFFNLSSSEYPDGFQSLGGMVKIENNDSLINIYGVEALRSIKGSIGIRGNPILSNIEGLEGLHSIGDNLYIEYNPSLQSCAIESICLYLENPSGQIRISNNLGSCGSEGEVISECNCCPNCITTPLNTWSPLPGNLNWSNSENWELGVVPTECHHVFIPSGHEVEITGPSVCRTLVIESGAIFTDVDQELCVACDN